MFVLRPIRTNDIPALEHFAFKASLGLTNLPKNPELLRDKARRSLIAFENEVHEPGDEHYVFVLEDSKTGEIAGTSSIIAKTGVTEPLYYYLLEQIADHPQPMEILRPVSYRNGPAEVCGLYLKANIRGGGVGKLLSLGRFLFMAIFPERFEEEVSAEMRGQVSEEGVAPFWEALGRRFLDIEFSELMQLEEQGRSFIPPLLPHWPLYVSLLPQDAQDGIGETHPHTVPALCLLEQQGFQWTKEIDLFDGGPKLTCRVNAISAIQQAKRFKVAKIVPFLEGELRLVANCRLNFRATATAIEVETAGAILSQECAKALEVTIGDEIIATPLPRKNA